MKSIAFIIPYIGKLPNYFPIYLKSCAFNPTVDFIFYIDDKTQYDFPENVKINYITFDDLKILFQKNFDIAISLDKPYKFCDYRPMYGEIFSDDLKNYDFWGYCDIDMIWGDIRKFVTDEVLDNYQRIYTHGHCSIFKNEEELNGAYKSLSPKEYQRWQDVVTCPESRCFDEWGGHAGGGYVFYYER